MLPESCLRLVFATRISEVEVTLDGLALAGTKIDDAVGPFESVAEHFYILRTRSRLTTMLNVGDLVGSLLFPG